MPVGNGGEEEEAAAADSREDISRTALSLSWATTGAYLRPPTTPLPCDDGKSFSSFPPLPSITSLQNRSENFRNPNPTPSISATNPTRPSMDLRMDQ